MLLSHSMYLQHAEMRCVITIRSNSAHDLGEDIDPEMLPDLEALQESFEIPAQLRMDLPPSIEESQQQRHPSRDSAYSQHHSQPQHQPHAGPDSFHKDASLYGPEHRSGHVSGATTPSGPRSSASDESLHPGGHYSHSGRPQQGAAGPLQQEASEQSPALLAHSKSLPLLDGFEGLTELQQQAADMLADVSVASSIMHARVSIEISRKHCMHAGQASARLITIGSLHVQLTESASASRIQIRIMVMLTLIKSWTAGPWYEFRLTHGYLPSEYVF